MIPGIKRDHSRFNQIVKGKIKQNLKKYINHGEIIGKRGNDFVSIPLPQIDLPRFRFGSRQSGGVGQGEGQPGTPLGPGDPNNPEAGNAEGNHDIEVDISLGELAQMLGEELELPRIEPKGEQTIYATRHRYTGIHSVGPDSLRHMKRSYKEALKRQIMSNDYDPEDPTIIPIKKDFRYRIWKDQKMPQSNAAIIYMMDVSGSMGDEQKEIVRTESFWIDTWLRAHYHDVEIRYIVHDAVAREVDRETFYHIRESGGTLISSAYRLCDDIIKSFYPPAQWNTYAFHFSDGDNWSGEDSKFCVDLLKNSLLPKVNLFCYGQVESRYGSGQFIKDVSEAFREEEKLVASRIENKEAIYRSLKDFLGKGK